MARDEVTTDAFDRFAINPPQPPTRLLLGDPHSPLVTIHFDTGAIEYGEDYQPDGAARTFWEAIGTVHGGALQERAEKAEATLAAIREYLETSDDDGIRTRRKVLGVLDAAGVPSQVNVSPPSSADLGEALGFAMAAMQPGAEPVFCHHEHAERSQRTTAQAGWGHHTIYTVTCPTCPARTESIHGHEMPQPWLLNEARCTDACAARHTNGPGCLMQPVWTTARYRARPGRSTAAADRCPQCGGDNAEAWALCRGCEAGK